MDVKNRNYYIGGNETGLIGNVHFKKLHTDLGWSETDDPAIVLNGTDLGGTA